MKTKALITTAGSSLLLAIVLALLLVASASAWSGSSWSKNTCGADLTTPGAEPSAWWVNVTDERGYVILDTTIPGGVKYTDLSVGAPEKDAGLHVITFKVANAANHADGLVTFVQSELNCYTAGTPGSKGDNGTNGQNGKDGANGANGTNGVNGTDGKNGVNGKDGAPGKAGKNGKAGKPGKTGKAGKCVTPPTGLVCTKQSGCGFRGKG